MIIFRSGQNIQSFLFWLYLVVWTFCFLFLSLEIIVAAFLINWGWDCSPNLAVKWNFYGYIFNNLVGCILFKVKSGFFLLEFPIDIGFIWGCIRSRRKEVNKRWIYLCILFLCWYPFSINYLHFGLDDALRYNFGIFGFFLLIPGFILNLKYAG
ncbi:MAG: hypothetical protein KGO49_12270, partial [Gammaproteobacteria bacterium]|nr:hypothetical protein [Gammaproteobacteria bacterium]